MSDIQHTEDGRNDREQDDGEPKNEPEPPAQGPSLTLLYSLIALALAVAIGLAILIVLPFYRRAEAHRPVSEIGLINSVSTLESTTQARP